MAPGAAKFRSSLMTKCTRWASTRPLSNMGVSLVKMWVRMAALWAEEALSRSDDSLSSSVARLARRATSGP